MACWSSTGVSAWPAGRPSPACLNTRTASQFYPFQPATKQRMASPQLGPTPLVSSGGDRSCAVLGCGEVRLAAPSLEFSLPLCAAHETTVQRLLSARSRQLAELAEECRKTIVQGPTRKTRQGRELERPDGSRFPFIR